MLKHIAGRAKEFTACVAVRVKGSITGSAIEVKAFITSRRNRPLLIASVIAIGGLVAVRWMLPDEVWHAAACREGRGISCAVMKVAQFLALVDLYVGVPAVVVGWIQHVGGTPVSKSRGFYLILYTAIPSVLMALGLVVLGIVLG